MPFSILLAGVIGSFLTGDLFNLFVCFEVMLIASYALIVLGHQAALRETLKYMLINIISSTLFVATVAYLYGTVGTLNMAHLSLRVAEVQQDGILSVIGLLFLIVFALKAGLFLFFWCRILQCTTGGSYSFVRRAAYEGWIICDYPYLYTDLPSRYRRHPRRHRLDGRGHDDFGKFGRSCV